MKMKLGIPQVAAAAACLLAASCITNPLEYGYRAAAGVPKREWQNPSPSLSQPPRSGHEASVSRYLSRGYRVVGHGSINARYKIDPQNARLLAIQKNADAAVFSTDYLGKQSERVAVPLVTAQSSGYAAYANSNNYASQAEAAGQTTVYGYQDQSYQLWNHRTTLLRK